MADRLSTLPDGLLSFILSKLPIRDAVRCSLISKQWRYFYTEMTDLVLSPYPFIPFHLTHFDLQTPTPTLLATVENRISDILRLHSSDLKSFSLSAVVHLLGNPVYGPGWWKFTPQSLSEWMICVARKNVKRLFLEFSAARDTPPPSLFSCNRLIMFTLHRCNLTTIPPNFAGFRDLTMCDFSSIFITDNALAQLILKCPLLEDIKLQYFEGLQTPVISAPKVTDLTVRTRRQIYVPMVKRLTVNCPKLKTLAISDVLDLTVNGMAFHELSPAIWHLEMEHGSDLIELSLSSPYTINIGYRLSANRFLELVGKLTSLKVLDINLHYRCELTKSVKRFPVPLLNLLSRLPNLERFCLSGQLILEEGEGDVGPPYPVLGNLQFVEIELYKYDEKELRLLCCLLEVAPALKELKLRPYAFATPDDEERDNSFSVEYDEEYNRQRYNSTLEYNRDRYNSFLEYDKERYNLFLEKWEALKKGHEQGKIPQSIREFSFHFTHERLLSKE